MYIITNRIVRMDNLVKSFRDPLIDGVDDGVDGVELVGGLDEQSAKELVSMSSKRTFGNGLLSAHFPSITAGRRWRLSRMSQAMSQPQANGS